VIDKFIGDGVMAVFPYGINTAISSAIQMIEKIKEYNKGRICAGYKPISIGIGINTGTAMVCVIGGKNRMSVTVIGDTVNLSSRLETTTKDYCVPIIVSQNSMYDIDKSRFDLRMIDRIKVKGKVQPVLIYEVFSCDNGDIIKAKRSTLKDFELGVALYHTKDIIRAQSLFQKCVNVCVDDIPAQIYLQRCKDFITAGIYHSVFNEFENNLKLNESNNFDIPELDSIRTDIISRIGMISYEDSPQKLMKTLRFIFWHCKSMFVVEEFMMNATHYHLRHEHLSEHERFLLSIKKLMADIESLEIDIKQIVFNARSIMVDWLSNHIAKSDFDFIRFYKEKNS